MPYTIEDYKREATRELLEKLSPHERVDGLSPRERVEGLSPREILKVLPPDEIQVYVDELRRKADPGGDPRHGD